MESGNRKLILNREMEDETGVFLFEKSSQMTKNKEYYMYKS